MLVLLTGASGFLGGRLASLLLERGHSVRAFMRPGRPIPAGVEPAFGDLEDPASLRRAVAGAAIVVHAAGLVRILAPRRAFWRTNVEGFDRLLEASREAGVERFLHVSSFLALGPAERAPGRLLRPELEPYAGPYFNEYQRTKAEADRRARQAAARGAPVAIVYPGVVYGPGVLTEGNLLVRHLLELKQGRVPALVGDPDCRWSLAFVEDVTSGVLAALERFRAGARWVLGGENLPLRDLYRSIEVEAGLRVPRKRLPDPVGLLLGGAWKLACRLFGGTPRLTPDLVRIYRHDWACDSSAAEAELGYRPRPFADGLRATLAWLERQPGWNGSR